MRTLWSTRRGRLRVALEFKAADLWVGAYWARSGGATHVWVCLVPMLPVHVEWRSEWER